jgi:prepilin-type N-terminal cleavage/methylation domain-containing protein
MRKAFTLVEVLVATVIATVAGAGLLQLNSNYTYLFSSIKDKSVISEVVSIVGLHADIKYNRTKKSLYDILDDTYEIENDDLRKYLKNQSYEYKEHLVDTITFGEDELGEDKEEFSMDDTQETSAMAPIIQFELIDVNIKNKTQRGSIMDIRLIEL